MNYDYAYFKQQVLSMTGIDLNAYKEVQMKRRIDTLISRHNLSGYGAFISNLKSDESLLEEFVSYLTINVSEFFRNPEQWSFLDQTVIPELISKFGKRLKIWSAACSTGHEPYSLVMTLSKHVSLADIQITATDIDKHILSQAKNGIYSAKSIASVPEEFRQKYFKEFGNHSFRIRNGIKSRVEFREHNLLKDPYLKEQHLILCRNVLIYFTEETKEEIFGKFNQSLTTGGNLFLGSTEQMLNYKQKGYERKSSFFFQKV